jgi:hypothetical protein
VRVNLGDADANALRVTDFLGERQSPSRDQDRHRCRPTRVLTTTASLRALRPRYQAATGTVGGHAAGTRQSGRPIRPAQPMSHSEQCGLKQWH